MYLDLVTAPADTPISLAEAKAHLRVDVSSDDDYITALIAAAVSLVDGHEGMLGGLAMFTQTWTLNVFKSQNGMVRLPMYPVQSVSGISYYDADDADQTDTVSNYYLHAFSDKAWLVPKDGFAWPSTSYRPDALRITFVAGYGVAADVPEDLKLALKFLVAHWYANREPVTLGLAPSNLPLSVETLLGRYKRGFVG